MTGQSDVLAAEWAATEYPGYQINRSGEVFNEQTGKIQKSWIMTNGYWAVTIMAGKRKVCYVHRLLARAFIDNPQSKKCVNHLNGIKADNSLSNLEWCTHAENMTHARETGLAIGHLTGPKFMIAATKKKVEQVSVETGEVVAEFGGLNCAMRETGLSSIRRCVVGIQSSTGGFAWRYKSPEDRP